MRRIEIADKGKISEHLKQEEDPEVKVQSLCLESPKFL
jgi:hypothetical protein